jgi:hypothetical protein
MGYMGNGDSFLGLASQTYFQLLYACHARADQLVKSTIYTV